MKWRGMVFTGIFGVAFAGVCMAYEIEKIDGVYQLVDDDGKVVETFWNPETGESPFKFEADASVTPEFFWREDGRYLAVNGGAARDRQVYLYAVDGNNFSSCTVPPLSDEQRKPLDEVGDDWVASGTEAVRWQPDGTLLMHVWAQERATSDAEPASANIWADVKMNGDKGEIVGTSTKEPSAPKDADRSKALDPAQLEGEHVCLGRNADGSEYEGKVTIKAEGSLLYFQWVVGQEATFGTGILEDTTVGVALEGGVAIYSVVPRGDGFVLMGMWKTGGAEKPTEESILVGTDAPGDADFRIRDVNGEYQCLRELPDDSQLEGNVTISGGDITKKVVWEFEDGKMEGEGLALGDGLAAINDEGLCVYAIAADKDGSEYLSGAAINGDGVVMQESLSPVD